MICLSVAGKSEGVEREVHVSSTSEYLHVGEVGVPDNGCEVAVPCLVLKRIIEDHTPGQASARRGEGGRRERT